MFSTLSVVLLLAENAIKGLFPPEIKINLSITIASRKGTAPSALKEYLLNKLS